MFENPTTITFDYDKKEKQYYVYGYGKLQGSYEIAGDAIQKADSYGGVVVDQSQSYICLLYTSVCSKESLSLSNMWV